MIGIDLSIVGLQGGQLWRRVQAFRREVRGVAALEFALISPIAIYTLLLATDLGNAMIVVRRLENAANVLGELASQQALPNPSPLGGPAIFQGGTTNPVTNAMLLGDIDSLAVTLPDMLSTASREGVPWTAVIQPIITSVVFGPPATCVLPAPANAVSATPPPHRSAISQKSPGARGSHRRRQGHMPSMGHIAPAARVWLTRVRLR